MYRLLTNISAWSVVLPFVVGCISIKNIKRDSIFIFIVVCIALIPQLIHFYLPKSRTEIISYNLYTVAEFFIYFFLFKTKMLNPITKRLFWFALFSYSSLAVYYIFSFGLTGRFINEIATLNGIACLLMIACYFYETFVFDSGELQRWSPFFWYFIGILIYSACTTLVYSLWQKIHDNPDSILQNLWNLQNIFNILTYILFSIGFLLENRTKTFIRK